MEGQFCLSFVFRGIDNRVYYMVDTSEYIQLINFSGCGNTVNANHPVVAQLIVDSLRHWVEEYHVDGFRFDLASCLCRGTVLCSFATLVIVISASGVCYVLI